MDRAAPSPAQRALAQALGVDLGDDSFDIAAARLLDAVAAAIGLEPSEPASEQQRALAASLGRELGADSRRVASARIGETLFARNQDVIAALDLKPGDRVVRSEQFELDGVVQTIEREFVISSIQPNGRVFFEGGSGEGAWPTQLRRPTG